MAIPISTLEEFQLINDDLSFDYKLINDIDFGNSGWSPIGPEGGQTRATGLTSFIGPSDFYSLINVGTINLAGTVTSIGSSNLIDSLASFETDGVAIGDRVFNTPGDDDEAEVTAVVSQTELTLSTPLFSTPGDFYLIENQARFLTDPIETNRVRVGDLAFNDTDSTSGIVTSVDSDTKLTVDRFLFQTGELYRIKGNGRGFSGTFDGQGFTISNFKHSASQSSFRGLFGKISGATIKNLNISGCTIDLEFIEYTGGLPKINVEFVGGMIGGVRIDGDPCDIQNCHITGLNFTAHAHTENKRFVGMGGLIGRIDTGTIVTGCSVSGTMLGLLTHPDEGIGKRGGKIESMGGCIGEAEGTDFIISNSSTNVEITLIGTGRQGSGDIGGFIGMSWEDGVSGRWTISNCFATGNIISDFENSDIGGFCGIMSTQVGDCIIKDCYATGNITRTRGLGSYTGGFSSDMYLDNADNFTVQDCYATGDITITAEDPDLFTGGFCGDFFSQRTIRCYATGNITVTATPRPSTSDGVSGVAGFAGRMWINNSVFPIPDDHQITEECYSTGDIIVNNPTGTGGLAFVAGFAGEMNGQNEGRFFGNYSTSNITTDGVTFFVGGFMGDQSGGELGPWQKNYWSGLMDLTVRNRGSFDSGFAIGGFAGQMFIDDGDILADAFSRGRLKITCPSAGDVNTIGGFVGCLFMDDQAELNNCYSAVTGAYASRNSGQLSRIGGFVGDYEGGDGTGSNNQFGFGIQNCWSAGPITRQDLPSEDNDFSGVVGSWGGDITGGGMRNCAVWSSVWHQPFGAPALTNFAGSDRGTDEPDNTAFELALGAASHIVYNQGGTFHPWDFATPIWYEHWDIDEYPDFDPPDDGVPLEPPLGPGEPVPEPIRFRRRK